MQLPRPESLTALAAKELKQAIVSGRFRPGERLVEMDLSQRFGISRAPIREAIRELAGDGLVEIRPNRGSFVACPSIDQLQQMILVRAIVEGSAARLVTFHRRPSSFKLLASILDRLDAANAEKDDMRVRELHWSFHSAICEEARNPYLLQSWTSISNLIRLYHSLTLNSETVGRNNRVFLWSLEHTEPAYAEALLRSQIIRMAYHYLGIPLTDEVRGYVTHYITDNGRVEEYKTTSGSAQ